MEITRVITAEIRRALAGFAPAPEDSRFPVTPPFMQKAIEAYNKANEAVEGFLPLPIPVFEIGTYTASELKRLREPLENGETLVGRFVELWSKGSGLKGWSGVFDLARGEDFPCTPANLQKIRTLEALVYWLNEEIMAFTKGLKAEEREGLG